MTAPKLVEHIDKRVLRWIALAIVGGTWWLLYWAVRA
jgi:hypothetical protein